MPGSEYARYVIENHFLTQFLQVLKKRIAKVLHTRSKAPYFQNTEFSLWIWETTNDFIKKWPQRSEDKPHVPPPSLQAQILPPWRSGGS